MWNFYLLTNWANLLNQNSMKVFISGDFAPRLRVNNIIDSGSYNLLFSDELRQLINDSDLSIVNLETPLVDSGVKRQKSGPNLSASPKSVEVLTYAGFDMVTMANNHILDYGSDGLKNTIECCRINKIDCVGAGSTFEESSAIYYKAINNINIAIINCCENEWSTLPIDGAMSNPLDEINIFNSIQEAKDKSDFILLIIHGGHEGYGYPSPRMKKLYRWFIDIGADAVIGHHTHCYSGHEFYKGKPIVYSLGNFLFDSELRNQPWNYGSVAVLNIPEAHSCSCIVQPIEQCNADCTVRFLSNEKLRIWESESKIKESIIKEDDLLSIEFAKFSNQTKSMYLSFLEPIKNKVIAFAIQKGFLPRMVKGYYKRLLTDIIRCESHRDLLIKSLTDNSK